MGDGTTNNVDGQPDFSVIYGTLANFTVEKKIGKGQFSEVYRAKCNINGVTVALKKVQVGYVYGSFVVSIFVARFFT